MTQTKRCIILSLCVCGLVSLSCLGGTLAAVRSTQKRGVLTQSFSSIGFQDGWVLESSDGSAVGSEIDSQGTGVRLGGDSAYNQFRTILSFDTSPLPDDAIVSSAALHLRQQSIVIGGGNPLQAFGGLLIDVKLGSFGIADLEPEDFQVPADVSAFGPYKPALASAYVFPLGRAAYPYINKWLIYDGLTQLRLRLKLESDRNGRANYIHFYSGDEPDDALRPQLVIQYHLPSRKETG